MLKSTISEYNSFCDQQYDAIFNKDPKYLYDLHTPPYYGIKCNVSFLDTIGGIKINEKMEVLDEENQVIPGFYAVGNDSNKLYGDSYDLLLPGSGYGFAVNSGRIAGQNASENITR